MVWEQVIILVSKQNLLIFTNIWSNNYKSKQIKKKKNTGTIFIYKKPSLLVQTSDYVTEMIGFQRNSLKR